MLDVIQFSNDDTAMEVCTKGVSKDLCVNDRVRKMKCVMALYSVDYRVDM